MVEIIKALQTIQSKPDEAGDAMQTEKKNDRADVPPSGWVSPRYMDSIRVDLNRDFLEKNRLTALLPEVKENETYKVLRTRIQQQMRANARNTLMITSVHAGEGKSLTAINMAAMFAREFEHTVLLVDADLKTQAIHKYLGYQSTKGLADYLLGDVDLKDIIIWPGVEKFTVISGGDIYRESSEILNSPRMRVLVEEMKKRYKDRYIFFDAPPVLGSPDAIIFSAFVDAVVLVVQEGKTPLPDIERALRLLPKDKFLGFIISGH